MTSPSGLDAETLSELWSAAIPECPPVAHELKRHCKQRWVRFHSLPQSKRYAETDDEYRIILERHNTILNHLAAPDETLVLLTAGFSEQVAGVDRGDLEDFDPYAEHWRTLTSDESEFMADGCSPHHLFFSEWRWSPGVFDDLLLRVADDQAPHVMLLSTQGAWVFHPYDGGADVILPTREERNTLRATFSEWLSIHPSGH